MSARADEARRANFGEANARRTAAAGERDAVRLARALELVPDCPPVYRKVAEARIAAPDTPWSALAASLGMTKDQAAGYRRRLLELSAWPGWIRQQEPRGGEGE